MLPSMQSRGSVLAAGLLAIILPTRIVAQDSWSLESTIDISTLLPTTGAVTGLAFLPWSGTLVVTVEAPSGAFAEIATDGTLLRTFDWTPSTFLDPDDSGLAADPTSETLFYINGLAGVPLEPLQEFELGGSLLADSPSDVEEAAAIAWHPDTSDLFVLDIYPRTLKRLSPSAGSYTTIAETPIPTTIFGFAGAGMAWNPFTGNLAFAGEFAVNNGVIFDMSLDGDVLGPYFDTGIAAGISGLDFDASGERMFVLTSVNGKFIHIYGRSWAGLGGGTEGIAGQPTLTGSGSLVGGTTASVSLTNAPPNAAMLAWISFAPVPFAALGGTVHAFPFNNQLFVSADAAGAFAASTTWPMGIPAGTQIWFQFIVEDATSIHGLTLSNGLRATTP